MSNHAGIGFVGHDAPVHQFDDAIAALGKARVVGDDEKGGAAGLVHIAQQPLLPPVGLKQGQIDAIQKEILNLGHNAIQPPYHPVVVPAEIKGRHILVIWVLGGQTRPYKARLTFAKDGKDYAYFIRKGSSTVRAKGADETELLSLAATVPFDDRIGRSQPSLKGNGLSPMLEVSYLTYQV